MISLSKMFALYLHDNKMGKWIFLKSNYPIEHLINPLNGQEVSAFGCRHGSDSQSNSQPVPWDSDLFPYTGLEMRQITAGHVSFPSRWPHGLRRDQVFWVSVLGPPSQAVTSLILGKRMWLWAGCAGPCPAGTVGRARGQTSASIGHPPALTTEQCL